MKFFNLSFAALMALSMPLYGQGLLQKAQQSPDGPRYAEGMVRAGQLQAGLVAEKTGVAPGKPIWVALRLVHDPHWHTYWRNPGDSGLPTRVEWQLPAGWKAGPIQWPRPTRLPVGPLANFGYEGEVLLAMELVPPPRLAGGEVTLRAQAHWLVCKDVCIPGEAALALRLPIASDAKALGDSASASQFEAARHAWPRKETGRVTAAYLEEKSLVFAWSSAAPDEAAGFFYPYEEGLILPAGAQRLSKTAQGWRLDVPLGESASTALQRIRKSGVVEGIWVSQNGPAMEWRAPLLTASAPSAVSLVSAGQTAAQAAPPASQPIGFGLLISAIGAALLGGLILNLMPCVFPVIGLKVLSFAESAHSSRQTVWRSLSFSLGVVLSFIALGLLLLALRSAGTAMGWGFQLQNPMIVLGLALLFVLIAMNLLGVFEMGLLAVRAANTGFAERASNQSGQSGAFFSGVLAVVVASPCTAPFMGSAIGFTATAGALETLAVFSALGVGMSLPYLLLAAWPSLLRALPRPGPWMLAFKQFMAFPMLAAAAWLFWVLANIQGANSVLAALLSAIGLAACAWIYGQFIQRGRLGVISGVGLVAMLGILVAAGLSAVRPQQTLAQGPSGNETSLGALTIKADWQPWAPGLAERLAAQGETVFVDFTASWCITCQANKVRVLEGSAVTEAFAKKNVRTLRADWTRQDPEIAKELARHGRNGVPLYLVYRPGEPSPRILSEWLTDREVIAAIAPSAL